jgi:hypothetical protein
MAVLGPDPRIDPAILLCTEMAGSSPAMTEYYFSPAMTVLE